jgi:TM2 domain-containing membrane protein YozV
LRKTYFQIALHSNIHYGFAFALVLSFFIPGLGQFYTGQLVKAVILFVAAIVFGAMSTMIIGIPFYVVVWLYSMYDAYTAASKA